MPPLAAVAANCSAEGNAITGKFIAQHVKSSFVITARGADNLQCAAGGETFIVKVRGQGRVDPPPVRDRGEGRHRTARRRIAQVEQWCAPHGQVVWISFCSRTHIW